MTLGRWDRFWRALDRARFLVRLMVLGVAAGLSIYIYYISQKFFEIIDRGFDTQADIGTIGPILAAVTAFGSVTIPLLANTFKEIWKDYRSGGTNWQKVEDKASEDDTSE